MTERDHDQDASREHEQRVHALFMEAVELPARDRKAFIQTQCGGDAEMEAELEDLLRYRDDTSDDDSSSAAPTSADVSGSVEDQSAQRWLGRTIGGVTLRRLIGSGGMGSVFEGVQQSPRRTVAVKILREAIPSDRALRRFEYEAQTLGRMDHVGIARIHAADLHDEHGIKVPYFVMEYIRGAHSITEYAEVKHLNLVQRLMLFRMACDAVGHAHQKGVLHRDLKPANILVDSRGQVQVIDFGVARSIDADQAETMFQTFAGQLIGTPRYMAPEQFAHADDLDARVDVYALGVILYELLLGQTPYEVTTNLTDAQRVIQDVDPRRPSSINRHLRGDLDAIILKALDKDRDRRYRDAAALSEDIGRHLEDEPVTAQAPTLLYTLTKIARRNKPLVSATAVVLLAIVTAAIVSMIFFIRERDARAELMRQSEHLKQVVAFQEEQIGSINPTLMGEQLGQSILDAVDQERRDALATLLAEINFTDIAHGSLRENLLEPSRAAIETQFADQPEVRLNLLETLARTRSRLGDLQGTIEMQREVFETREALFGRDNATTLQALHVLADLYNDQFLGAEAAELYGELVDRRRRLLGDLDPATLDAIRDLANAHRYARNFDAAERFYTEALAGNRITRGNEHTETIWSMGGLANLLADQGRFEDAEPLSRETLELLRRRDGDMDPITLRQFLSHARILTGTGDHEVAEQHLRRALDGMRKVHGKQHQDTQIALQNLAVFLHGLDRNKEAIALALETESGWRIILGPTHSTTLASIDLIIEIHGDLHEEDPTSGHAAQARAWQDEKATRIREAG